MRERDILSYKDPNTDNSLSAAPATEGQSTVFTPSTTTATLPTPEATHIQFTGIEW